MPTRRTPAPILTVAAALAATLSGCVGAPPERSCSEHELPVRTRPADPVLHRVAAQLCQPAGSGPDTPVQVLLHGGTYDRKYWDWPYRPSTYSYVEHANLAGFATLNVDRLGHGASDRPDPQALDSAAHGYTVHQVVRALREGGLGTPFRTVVLNGHSMGGIAAERAAAHGGVDAVIISGIPAESEPGPEREGGAESGPPDGALPFWPAEQDPAFADRDLPAGYLTTRPGARAELFLSPGAYEPEMAALEEMHKDTVTAAELRGVGAEAVEPPPVGVPVLYVLGRQDALICRITRDCATDPAGSTTREIIEDSGHSINLGAGAGTFYRRTISWLAEQGITGRPAARGR